MTHSQIIMDAMERIDGQAKRGASVAISKVRAVSGLSKTDFDSAIYNLCMSEVIDMHRYDYTIGLTQEERDNMIPDGQGAYYIAVSIRV